MGHLLFAEPPRALESHPIAVPLPLLLRGDGVVVQPPQDVDGVPGASFQRVEYRELAHEFYLRDLLALEIASDKALMAFMEEHGLLGVRWSGRELGRSALRHWQLAQEAELQSQRGTWRHLVPVTTLTAARLDAAALRNAARCLLADAGLLEERQLLASWEGAPEPPFGPMNTCLAWSVEDLHQALADTSRLIESGLGPFQPRVLVGGVSLDGERWNLLREDRPVSLFAGTCAQMFNHIAEGATYKRCERKDCGRAFVRQSGRAKRGQYQTSSRVRYCSSSCAAVMAERNRGQSKKALQTSGEGTAR